MAPAEEKARNRAAWAGPLVGLFGLLSYFTIFYRWPVLRDFPWLNLLLLLVACALSLIGLRRAFAPQGRRRIGAALGATLSLGLTALFVWYCFLFSYRLPDAAGALAVGEAAPKLVLTDHRGAPFDLGLAAERRTVLVFYRGHW